MNSALHYFEGVDFAWIGTDASGYVGIFFTGGAGPIPISALRVHNEIDLEERLASIEPLTNHRLHIQYERTNDFVDMTIRGVFAFDWGDVHRTTTQAKRVYELVASPENPLTIAQLPLDLQPIASATQFENLSFVQCIHSGLSLDALQNY